MSSHTASAHICQWENSDSRRFPIRLLTSDLCIPAAPSAPSFIHFSELTTTSVNVSWGEPTFPNGIIEGFRLVYEPCTPVDGKALILTCSIFSSLLK